MAKRKRTPIPDAEWALSCQLQIGGVNVGPPLAMIHSDAYLAKGPFNVEHLIASRLDEASVLLKKQIATAKRKKK